ncbi:MAG: HYR domain-containing protein, partial [Flavobacteriaceae bacterium]|nr:HYR domain-containing protein [Flavobacteriaceae bacterium]
MKKTTFLTLFSVILAVAFSFGQSFTASGVAGNSTQNDSPGSSSLLSGLTNPNRAPVVITHSNSQTVSPGTVTCNAGGLPAENSFYRVFDLANDFGIAGDFNVTSAEFGVEAASAATNMTVNIYSTIAVFPAGFPGSLTLQGTASVPVGPGDVGNVVSGAVNATIPAGEIMVYELLIPDLQGAGISFFPGSNALGQTDPSYIRAPACGLTNPGTLAAIGFPNVHMVMNIVGEEAAASTTVCATDNPQPLGPGNGVTTLSNANVALMGTIGLGGGQFSIDQVSIDLVHTWAADLEIILISPTGTQVALSTDNGGSTGLDTRAFLIFRDDSPNSITSWTSGAPLANYRAEGGATTHPVPTGAGPGANLNTVFAGEPVNGNWTLRLYDDSGGDGGTIFDFCIDFVENPPVGDPPQIVCPLDITVNTSDYPQNDCGAQVFFANAQAFDPEDGLIPVTQTMGPGTGSVFPVGDTIIEFSATDSDGNTSTCQFTVTVLDDVDPIAVCQAITVELDASGTV